MFFSDNIKVNITNSYFNLNEGFLGTGLQIILIYLFFSALFRLKYYF